MKMRFAVLAILSLVATSSPLHAQTKQDDEEIRRLPQIMCDAWNKHDGHAMAQPMADDVDFVTVATVYLHGKADFEKFHTRLISERFKTSTMEPLHITSRFLRPDFGVVHWSWRIAGDLNYDKTPREPRFGMMTLVVEKRSGRWVVVVAQNTNSLLGTPPELEGIETPIPVPGPGAKP